MIPRRVVPATDWIEALDATYGRPVPEDEEAAAHAYCTFCGHLGLKYHPLIAANGRYVALAECPKCGHSTLF